MDLTPSLPHTLSFTSCSGSQADDASDHASDHESQSEGLALLEYLSKSTPKKVSGEDDEAGQQSTEHDFERVSWADMSEDIQQTTDSCGYHAYGQGVLHLTDRKGSEIFDLLGSETKFPVKIHIDELEKKVAASDSHIKGRIC